MSKLCHLVHPHERVPCLGTCSCEATYDFNNTKCIIGSFSNVDDNGNEDVTNKKSFFFKVCHD